MPDHKNSLYHSVTLEYIKYNVQILFIMNCSTVLSSLANGSTIKYSFNPEMMNTLLIIYICLLEINVMMDNVYL